MANQPSPAQNYQRTRRQHRQRYYRRYWNPLWTYNNRHERQMQERALGQLEQEHLAQRSPDHNELFDEIIKERLFQVYNLEMMDPEERWNQEQIEQLEGFVVLKRLASIQEQHIESDHSTQAENTQPNMLFAQIDEVQSDQ